MAGRTADDGTEANDGVVFTRFCHFLSDQRDFKSARNPSRRNIIIVDAVTMESIVGAAEQFAANKFIETSDDNTKLRTRTD